jgi:hypothetical protein
MLCLQILQTKVDKKLSGGVVFFSVPSVEMVTCPVWLDSRQRKSLSQTEQSVREQIFMSFIVSKRGVFLP